MVEINWLKEAKNDLNEIYDYISKDSKKYASRQVEKIFDRSLILKDHIHSGKVVEEINIPDVREIIEGNYRIIYRIKSRSEVDVLMVHHSARDLRLRIQ